MHQTRADSYFSGYPQSMPPDLAKIPLGTYISVTQEIITPSGPPAEGMLVAAPIIKPTELDMGIIQRLAS